MKAVSDHRQNRQSPAGFGVGDLPIRETFDAELVGRRYLTETAREAREFLPPPRVRPRRPALPPREPEGRLSKVAKLAGLTTAGTLLVGAVVASSMVTRARTEQAGRSTLAPPSITGTAALGGFAMQGSTKTTHGTSSVSSPKDSTPSPATQSHLSQTPPATSDTGSQDDMSTTPTSRTPTNEKLATVKEFYRRMGSQRPQDALAMLDPGLAGDQPGDLVLAWSSMSRVEVEGVHVQPDGSALAVVDMVRQDGTRLRVTQELELTKDVIKQAVLLSAEQL